MMGKDFDNPYGITTPKGEIRKMSSLLDSGVFPGTQGGPLEHIIAAKAVAFHEALSDEYMAYIIQVQRNARAMAKGLVELGYQIISGGTDNHLLLVDLRPLNVTGDIAEQALDEAGITVNKNMIPYDPQPAKLTSGIRVGTPALTSRGMGPDEMIEVGKLIGRVLHAPDDEDVLAAVRGEVEELVSGFPVPGIEDETQPIPC